jgi:SAM-dependent methyltransferase
MNDGNHLCPICCGRQRTIQPFRSTHRLQKCERCGMAQLTPLPTPEELDRIYADAFGMRTRLTDEQMVEDARKMAQSYPGDFPLEFAAQTGIPQQARILDIGASFGYDLYAFKKAGYSHASGVEISDKARHIAAAALGITLVRTVEDLPSDEYFDLIYLKHNLEHQLQPVALIQQLSSRLRPSGHLLVGVPNCNSLNARLFGLTFWEWYTPPVHTYYFTPRSLAHLINRFLTVDFRFSRRGHGQPLLRHITYFSPLTRRWIGHVLGDAYQSKAPYPRLRQATDRAFDYLSCVSRAVSRPLKAYLEIGEEIWIAGVKKPV